MSLIRERRARPIGNCHIRPSSSAPPVHALLINLAVAGPVSARYCAFFEALVALFLMHSCHISSSGRSGRALLISLAVAGPVSARYCASFEALVPPFLMHSCLFFEALVPPFLRHSCLLF